MGGCNHSFFTKTGSGIRPVPLAAYFGSPGLQFYFWGGGGLIISLNRSQTCILLLQAFAIFFPSYFSHSILISNHNVLRINMHIRCPPNIALQNLPLYFMRCPNLLGSMLKNGPADYFDQRHILFCAERISFGWHHSGSRV